MSEIVAALEEHRLAVRAVWMDANAIAGIRQTFQAARGELVGIACLRYPPENKSSDEVGHFVVVTAVSGNDEFTTYDASSMMTGSFLVQGNARFPLLFVSTKEISDQSFSASVFDFARMSLASQSFTIALAGIALLMYAGFSNLKMHAKPVVASAGVLIVVAMLAIAQPWKPKVFFSEPVYVLGECSVGSKARGFAVLVNHSRKDLNVKNVVASCGCMTVRFEPTAVVAGGAIELPVEFSTCSKGFSRYGIIAFTDQGDLRCDFEIEGIAALRVVPAQVVIGEPVQIASASPIIHDLRIRDYWGNPRRIDAIVPKRSDAMLSVSAFEGDTLANGNAIKLLLVPTEYAIPGIHFTDFVLTLADDLEPLTIGFRVGVEFRDFVENTDVKMALVADSASADLVQ